jgi:hypothetical protein
MVEQVSLMTFQVHLYFMQVAAVVGAILEHLLQQVVRVSVVLVQLVLQMLLLEQSIEVQVVVVVAVMVLARQQQAVQVLS